jgi:transposase
MADIHEQSINIKFGFKLGKTLMETHEMMKNVYGDQCMSCTHCYEWMKRFKDGWQTTHDEPRLGRPSTSYDDAHVQVREIVCSNRCLTERETAEEGNISIGSCHGILMTKLEMYWVVSKFVP